MGFRLACNRDESRLRPAALPPQIRHFGNRRAVLPVDPVSDGTWIAVNDAGLAMTLLNVYQGRQPPKPSGEFVLSRGLIIPSLLSFDNVLDASDRAAQLDANRYPPFRLLLVDRFMLAEIRGDSEHVEVVMQPRTLHPLMFTSSGLGDSLVEEPRRRLFEEMFTPDADEPATQREYHRHQWPDRPHLSVCMSREKARTVSFAIVEVMPPRIELCYYPEAPNIETPAIVAALDAGELRKKG